MGRLLSIHNPDSGTWQRVEEHDTVFQDALNLDYSTAVAGWYNPYCRVLPDVLDRCFWTFSFSAQKHDVAAGDADDKPDETVAVFCQERAG